ncbi:hypothetical protein E1298_14990 [Actinomadura rubrisoli]|uniref:DUF11 domain-containing protein n=1 Tax=Actinomadura rubrisoli TaxID=2530368 RepID=A0A4R5BW65_9ACTN|nr:hypothetical protein E1298_14990 [Actinomadura rubrisoli]
MELPKSLRFVGGQPGCSVTGRKVVCRIGTVRPGQTTVGVITTKVSKRAKVGRTMRIRGTVTWGGARASRSFPAVRVAETADLAMSKSAPATSRAGAAIPYEMRVRNLGPSTAENVVVRTDGLARLVEQDAACVPQRAGFVCAVGSLPAGQERTLRIKAVPGGNAREGAVVKSRSRATSATTDVRTGNNAAVARTTITRAAAGAPDKPEASAQGAPSGGKPTARAGGARAAAYVSRPDSGGGAPSGVMGPVKALAESPLTGIDTAAVFGLSFGVVGGAFALTRLGRARRREQD